MPKTISARISDDLAKELNDFCKKTGVSKTQVVSDGVRFRLDDLKDLFSNDDLTKR